MAEKEVKRKAPKEKYKKEGKDREGPIGNGGRKEQGEE